MRRFSELLRFLVVLLWLGYGMAWAQQNVIQAENAKPGNATWELEVTGANPEVEGYASHTSVNRGETIRFYVSSSTSTYKLDIYRMGWYGGAGGRLMHSVTLQGAKQPTPLPDSVTGMVECNWTESYRLAIPNTTDKTDWASGIYLAKLTPNSTGVQSYIIFVVRDETSQAPYVFQSTDTTWQAYNEWGGKSLYAYNSVDGPAVKVSFNRPYARFYGNWSAGSASLFNWEYSFVQFLEREGYDVTYLSSLDIHTNGSQLLNHRAFLVAGHNEYWSYQMKSAALAAQAQGVHFGFFTANEAYWQVRFEPSSTGEPNRTMVGYKESAQTLDPLTLDGDPSNDKFITTRFRDLQPIFGVNDSVAQPENGLVGVMFHGEPFDGDIVVSDSKHWVYGGAGVSNGTRFAGLLGYETDTVANNGYSPPQLRKAAESPDPWGFSHVASYTSPSGSTVFATGSMQWNWGLESATGNAAVKQTTRNVLARLGAAPIKVPTNLQAAAASQTINLTWSAPAGASSFNVFRSQTAGAEGFTPYRTGLSSPSFSDADLYAGTYYYTVSAATAVTESAQSAEASASVGGSPPPPPVVLPNPPTALTATLAKNNKINLTWTQSSSTGVTGNKVYRGTSSAGPFSLVTSLAATTSYLDNSVAKKKTYYYVVTAVSSAGESAYSNTASQTTR